MPMSKKDYRAFAEMLHNWRDSEYFRNIPMQPVIDTLAGEMCQIFARDNSRFSSERFLTAVREGIGCKK